MRVAFNLRFAFFGQLLNGGFTHQYLIELSTIESQRHIRILRLNAF
ncbi:Uncharacterised protein [Vibrio cholerae]|nr:Uncharacterised protein [Vibrio cholerae]